MSKRKYTQIKAIEPEIIAMREAGKTRREIAEHFGLKKRQITWWVSRYNKAQAKLAAGITPRPKGVHAQTQHQEILLRSRHMRSIVSRWKTSFCGSFCV